MSDNILDRPHLCFSSDHDRDDAVRQFVTRYGQPPQEVIYGYGNLWVGPIPEEEER